LGRALVASGNGLQKDLKYRDGTPLSKEKAWTMITNALNTVGKAVKNSSYT